MPVPFSNQASLLFRGTTINSNTVTGLVLDTLAVTKTAVNPRYTPGSDNVYVITIENSGAEEISGVTLTDNLGSFTDPESGLTLVPLTYVDGTALISTGGAVPASITPEASVPALVFNNITVPADSNVTIYYTVRANEYAPLYAGSSITNRAELTGDSITAPLSDTATVEAEINPILSINKEASSAMVSEGDEMTFTFTLTNRGNINVDAADNLTFVDNLDPILSDIDVTFNGTPWTNGTEYTYDTATGEFRTNPNAVTVDAATYTRAADGSVVTNAGESTLVITGTV